MSSSSSQSRDILLCSICESKFKDPRIVQCGKTFCNQCITQSSDYKLCFKCICGKKHVAGRNGFAINETVAQLLLDDINNKFEKIEELKSNLNKINEQLNFVNSDLRLKEDRVKIYCRSVKKEINKVADAAIDAINKQRKSLLAELDDYQQKCVSSLEENSFFEKEITESLSEATKFYKCWSNCLKISKLSNHEIDNAIYESKNQLKILNEKRSLVKSYIFKGTQIKFNQNNDSLLPTAAIGSFEYQSLNTFVDFRCLLKFDLNSINKQIFDFDVFPNGNILLCTLTSSNTVDIEVYDNNKNVIKQKSIRFLDVQFINCHIKDDKIICAVNYLNHSSHIYILRSFDFKISHQKNVALSILYLHINSSVICCLSKENVIRLYDYSLKAVRECSDYYNSSGYIYGMVINEEYIFLMHKGLISLIDINDFSEVKRINLESNSNLFSLYNDYLIICKPSSLVYMGLNGDIKYKSCIEQPCSLSALKGGQDKLILYDYNNKILFYMYKK